MKAERGSRRAILSVLGRFQRAVASRDLEGALDIFSGESDVFLMGSEAGETASGPVELEAIFKRVFARPFAYSFEWKKPSVSTKGPVAWVQIDAGVRKVGSHERRRPYRITMVLTKTAGRWLIEQYHGSEPATA